jgi:putative Holliday junction resolvase
MPSDDPRRILALDLGAARIGAAVGERGVATPLAVLPRRGRDADVRAIGALAKAEGAELIVVGLPAARPDDEGEAGAAARRFGRRLGRALGIAVEFADEFETTVQAEEALVEAGLGRARRREVVDKVAASLILQRWWREGPTP